MATILEDLFLDKDPSVALERVTRVLEDKPRFTSFYFVNDTQHFIAVLVLYQGIDEVQHDLPPGYVRNTGVIVGAQNVAPHSSQTSAVPVNIDIVPNRVKCSLHWRSSDGKEGDFTCKDDVAPAGEFIKTAGFGISEHATNLEIVQHLPGRTSLAL